MKDELACVLGMILLRGRAGFKDRTGSVRDGYFLMSHVRNRGTWYDLGRQCRATNSELRTALGKP